MNEVMTSTLTTTQPQDREKKDLSPSLTAWIGSEASHPAHPVLWNRIASLLDSLGYELIHMEVHIGRQNILRLFIEHAEWSKGGIGIEDCARVSRSIDEPLDAMPEVESLFHGAYELEVSSPGVDRPLRKLQDFNRFKDREVRLYIDRPLTAEESNNAEFCKKHPKQKTFLGISQGVTTEGKIELDVMKDEGTSAKTKGRPASPSKGGKKGKESVLPRITLPAERITKANLEPDYDTSGTPVEEIEGGTEL
jgi:ribosome maturation factor RimP